MTIDPYVVAVDQHLVDLGIGHEDVEGAESGHVGKRRRRAASRARRWSPVERGVERHGRSTRRGRRLRRGRTCTRHRRGRGPRSCGDSREGPVERPRQPAAEQEPGVDRAADADVPVDGGHDRRADRGLDVAWSKGVAGFVDEHDTGRHDTEPARTADGEVAGAGDEPALGGTARRTMAGSRLVPASTTTDPPLSALHSVSQSTSPSHRSDPTSWPSAPVDARSVSAGAGAASSSASTSIEEVVEVRHRGVAAQPVDDAGSVGLGESEHRGDVAVEIDEQNGTDRVDGTGARDDRGAAAALGGVAERDHGFPQVGRAGRDRTWTREGVGVVNITPKPRRAQR